MRFAKEAWVRALGAPIGLIGWKRGGTEIAEIGPDCSRENLSGEGARPVSASTGFGLASGPRRAARVGPAGAGAEAGGGNPDRLPRVGEPGEDPVGADPQRAQASRSWRRSDSAVRLAMAPVG